MKRKWYTWLLFCAVAIWFVVIWCFSMQTGEASTAISDGLARRALVAQGKPVDDISAFSLEVVLRKGAHVAEFFVLALLCACAFQAAGGMHPVYKAHALCTAAAIIDEVHQLFVPGRMGLVNDVVIDIIGACAGLFLFVLVRMYIRGKKAAEA